MMEAAATLGAVLAKLEVATSNIQRNVVWAIIQTASLQY